ncbi:MAG: ABC transporter substrate-binding protein [Dactylosporangium sp.]|nr:ABC transporter substrate-binding protein [Dactylosporangium sp.]
MKRLRTHHGRPLLRTAVAVLGATALMLSAACGGGGESPDTSGTTTIKVGFVGSLTGPLAPSGQVALVGLQAGAEYVHSRDPNVTIEIVERDTQGEPTQAVAATRALVQEGVSAIWFTTEAFPPVQDYLNQVKIPGATAGGIGAVLPDVGDSKKYKYAFSTGAGTSGETSIIPLLAYAASAGDTVAMLDDSSAFGTAQSELTKTIAKRDFPTVTIVHKTFPSTASDNTAELSELRDSGAQSLIVWSYGAPLVTTMNSLNRIGWNPQMSGVLGIGDPSVSELIPDGMKDTLAAGPIAKTFVSSTPGAEPTGITAEFVKLYLKLRNKTDFNALDTVGAMSFDWALLVAEAVQRAGSTEGEAIKNQLVSAGEFEGANGTYTFGPDKRIGLDADDLSVFVPAKPCENNICVEASIG